MMTIDNNSEDSACRNTRLINMVHVSLEDGIK